MTRTDCLRFGWICFGVSVFISTIAAWNYQNPVIIALTLSGIALGLAYSATCTYGMGRGWGELAVGVAFGPLPVLGSYILQTNELSGKALLAGVPIGFLIMGVLILNEFPDAQADRAVGKRTWIVRARGGTLGVWIYLAVITMAYGTVLAGVIARIFPVKVLCSLFTLPLAVWIVLKLWQNRERVTHMVPILAGNIGLHLLTGLLISWGLWGR